MKRTASWKLILVVAPLVALVAGFAMAATPVYSAETPFAVDNPAFRDFYQKRGGVRNLGYPISHQFTLQGFQVQMFQRGVLQLMPGGSVATMNLLDEGLMPYTSFNFSQVPAPRRDMAEQVPPVTDPDYGAKAIEFVRREAPDEWEGLPVNFFSTFMSTVRYEDAFPEGGGEPALVPLLNLEVWGLPTSKPAFDPNNRNFVYQRFQRGIMHFDATNGTTQGLLLGHYLKAIMTGEDLPADVESQARSSPFFRQYDRPADGGPLRPPALPATNLDGAFRAGTRDPRFGVVFAGPGSDDPRHVTDTLTSLQAGSWYNYLRDEVRVAGRVELVRPGVDLSQLVDRARSRPGRAWMIGNEPNVPGQDNLEPAAYADFLRQATGAIKSGDPTARLVGPNVLNWDATCTGCPGFSSGRTWSEAFLASYRQKYGPLPLDIWGIHTYTVDWLHLPMANAGADQSQLAAARLWLDSSGLRVPIWLTEFGVIWGYEGLKWVDQNGRWVAQPEGRFRDDLIASYLDSMLRWLTGPGAVARVERWFLYAARPPAEPYASATAGAALLQPDRPALTPLGDLYRNWAAGMVRRE